MAGGGTGRPADERLAAWLSLDRADNDPASFWTYVIAALQTVAPGVGESALTLLQAPQPPPIETVLTALLNDLGAITGDIVLVLDDYHVIDARDVQDGMAFLLDHLPPRLHVVIASRDRSRVAAGPAGERAASWSRLARPICASRLMRPRRTSTR